jgi:hypothetical protein
VNGLLHEVDEVYRWLGYELITAGRTGKIWLATRSERIKLEICSKIVDLRAYMDGWALH